jgi:transcriptional regulator with XRE-family HTH domain
MHMMHKFVNRDYAQPAIHLIAGVNHTCPMAAKHRRKTFLREWRRSKPGRTLEQVAAELHISQPQLGRIERGDSPYNQDMLESLAELYGCSVADLLMRDPSDPDGIWSIWDNALPGDKRMISAAAEAVVNALAEERKSYKGAPQDDDPARLTSAKRRTA